MRRQSEAFNKMELQSEEKRMEVLMELIADSDNCVADGERERDGRDGKPQSDSLAHVDYA